MPAAVELMMLNILLIKPGEEHTMLNIGVNLWLIMLRPRGSSAVRESHEHTRNTLKHSTSSHKWWETLKARSFM